MITVKGIELDFDVQRNADAKRLDASKPSMLEAVKVLESKEVSYDTVADVCIKAVVDLLGSTEADKLGMDAGKWLECITTFSEVCAEVTKQENETKEILAKYKVDRLGV